ncbi:MAG: AAA family ATPase, partial [Methanimicrococcus sp.]|nr:AAA family ATPase [Methanimicrococcus sp.]
MDRNYDTDYDADFDRDFDSDSGPEYTLNPNHPGENRQDAFSKPVPGPSSSSFKSEPSSFKPEPSADPALVKTYENAGKIFSTLFEEIEKVIVGQNQVIEEVMIALLCNGHALLESNPGLGKTLTISTISKVVDLSFNRIQCTPDLMPADITGTTIVEEYGGSKKFRFEQGPVFANIVLADE